MAKLLSIVIPVYKVEQYINKCLDSLLIYKTGDDGTEVLDDELMSLMDILIINDGTPDRSAEMSREYVKRYPAYFRQIDKENGGHGSVWNLGLKEAYGKYTRFLDSDDWLENLDTFLLKLKDTESDLVLNPVRTHYDKGEVWAQKIVDMEFYRAYDADKFDWLGNRTGNYLLHHCCTYKTYVLKQFLPGLFLEKQPYDDVVLWPAAMIGAKSIEAFDFPFYNYLMGREGQSMSEEVMSRNRKAMMKSHKHKIEFYVSHPVAKGTTKSAYIDLKLPKAYNIFYKDYTSIPYKEGRQLLKEWDGWVKDAYPDVRTVWITAYRVLPYCLYRPMVQLVKWFISRRKTAGPVTWICENE